MTKESRINQIDIPIKLCYYNKANDQISTLLNAMQMEHSIQKCFSRCNTCHLNPIAKVDDYLISADTPDELCQRIKRHIVAMQSNTTIR